MAKELRNETRPTEQEISERAHEIYVQSGSIPGRDLENWLAAERQLTQERSAKATASDSSASMSAEGFKKPAEPQTPSESRAGKTQTGAVGSKSVRKQQVGILPGRSSSHRIV